MLVLVHRMAATRLGFPNLYSALNDQAPEALKSGLTDGTAWVVRPFIKYVLPLINAVKAGNDFEAMSLLRKYCPRLEPERLTADNAGAELTTLQSDLIDLATLLQADGNSTIGDVVTLVNNREIVVFDERFLPLIDTYSAETPLGENTSENAVHRFMLSGASELWGYQTYIEDQSPFATQQGIKGAEFDRVLVVVDDEEARYNQFSYGKYFGLTTLSDTDLKNQAEGKDSVIDRTRRLFYVCCSRAVQDLAVVVFAPDVDAAHAAILDKGFFEPDNIHRL